MLVYSSCFRFGVCECETVRVCVPVCVMGENSVDNQLVVSGVPDHKFLL